MSNIQTYFSHEPPFQDVSDLEFDSITNSYLFSCSSHLKIASNESKISDPKPSKETSISRYPSIKLSAIQSFSKLVFSPSNLSVLGTCNEEELVIANWPLNHGSAYWEVECPINCENIAVGIIKEGFTQGQHFNFNSPFASLWTFRTSTPRTIGIRIDFEKNELRCWLNGNFLPQKIIKIEANTYWPCIKIKEKGNYAIFNPFAVEPGHEEHYKERFVRNNNKLLSVMNGVFSEDETILKKLQNWIVLNTGEKSYESREELFKEINYDGQIKYFAFESGNKDFLIKVENNPDVLLSKLSQFPNFKIIPNKSIVEILRNLIIDSNWSPNNSVDIPNLIFSLLKKNLKGISVDLVQKIEGEQLNLDNLLNQAHLNIENISKEPILPLQKNETSVKLELINENLLIYNGNCLKLLRRERTGEFNLPFELFNNCPESVEDEIDLSIPIEELKFLLREMPWNDIMKEDFSIYIIKEFLSQISNAFITNKIALIRFKVKYWKIIIDNLHNFIYSKIDFLQEIFKQPLTKNFIKDQLFEEENQALPFAENVEKPIEKSNKSDQNPSLETLYILFDMILKLEAQFFASIQSFNYDSILLKLYPSKLCNMHISFDRLRSYASIPQNLGSSVIDMAENGLYNIGDNLKELRHFLAPSQLLRDMRDYSDISDSLKKLLPFNRMINGLANGNIDLSSTINRFPVLYHGTQGFKTLKIDSNSNYFATFSKDGLCVVWNAELCLFKVLSTNFRESVKIVEKTICLKDVAAQETDDFFYGKIFDEEIPAKKKSIDQPPKEKSPEPEIIPDPIMLEALYSMGFPMELAKKALIKTKNGDLSAALDTIIQIQEEEKKNPKPNVKTNTTLLKPNWKCNACTYLNLNSLNKNCQMCGSLAPIEAFYTEEELRVEENVQKQILEEQQREEKVLLPGKVIENKVEEITIEEKQRVERARVKEFLIKEGTISGEFMIKFKGGILSGVCFREESHKGYSLMRIRRFAMKKDVLLNYISIAKNEQGFINNFTKEFIKDESINAIENNLFEDECKFNVEVLTPLFSGSENEFDWECAIEQDFDFKADIIHEIFVKQVENLEKVVLLVLSTQNNRLELQEIVLNISLEEKKQTMSLDKSPFVLFSYELSRIESPQSHFIKNQLLYFVYPDNILCFSLKSNDLIPISAPNFQIKQSKVLSNNNLALWGQEKQINLISFDNLIEKSIISQTNNNISDNEKFSDNQILDPKTLTSNEIKSLRQLLLSESLPCKAKNTFRNSGFDKKTKLFKKHTWIIDQKQQDIVCEIETAQASHILKINLELFFDFVNSNKNTLNQLIIEKPNLLKEINSQIIEKKKNNIENNSVSKPQDIMNQTTFSLNFEEKIDSSLKNVSKTYIPLKVVHFEGAAYNKSVYVTRLISPNNEIFISNYSNSLFVLQNLHESILLVDSLTIISDLQNNNGGHPIGSGMIFLLNSLSMIEYTKEYDNLTLKEYQDIFRNQPLRNEWQPVAYFSMEEKESITFELECKRNARFIIVKPTNFREKPNNYTNLFKTSSVEIKFIGAIGKIIDSEYENECFNVIQKSSGDYKFGLIENILPLITLEISSNGSDWFSLSKSKENLLISEFLCPLQRENLSDNNRKWRNHAENGLPISNSLLLEISDPFFKTESLKFLRFKMSKSNIIADWSLKTIQIDIQIPSIKTFRNCNRNLLREMLLNNEFYQDFNQKIVNTITNEECSFECRRQFTALITELMQKKGISLIEKVFKDLDLFNFIRLNILCEESNQNENYNFLKLFIAIDSFADHLLQTLYKIIGNILEYRVTPLGLKSFLGLFSWCYGIDPETSFFEILTSLRKIINVVKDYRNPHYNLLRLVFDIPSLPLETELFSLENISALKTNKKDTKTNKTKVSISNLTCQNIKKPLKSRFIIKKNSFSRRFIIDLFDICEISEMVIEMEKHDIYSKVFMRLWGYEDGKRRLILDEILKESTSYQLGNLAFLEELNQNNFVMPEKLNSIGFKNLKSVSRYLILQFTYTYNPPYNSANDKVPSTGVMPEFYGIRRENTGESSKIQEFNQLFDVKDSAKFLQNLILKGSNQEYRCFSITDKDSFLLDSTNTYSNDNKNQNDLNSIIKSEESRLKVELIEAQSILILKLQQNRSQNVSQAEKDDINSLCEGIEDLQIKLFSVQQTSNKQIICLDYLYTLIIKLSQMLKKIDKSNLPFNKKSWRQNDWIQNEQGKLIALEFFENMLVYEQINGKNLVLNPSEEILSLLTETIIDNLNEKEWLHFIIIIVKRFLAQPISLSTTPVEKLFSHNRVIHALDRISIPNGEILCYLSQKLGIKYDINHEKMSILKPFFQNNQYNPEDKRRQDSIMLCIVASLLILLYKGFSKIPFEVIDPKKITHKGSYCFNCGQSKFITGTRLKCLNCPNLDCCSDVLCELKHLFLYPTHCFILIEEPLPLVPDRRNLIEPQALSSPFIYIEPKNNNHGIPCDACQKEIVGTRLMCGNCEEFSLCKPCYENRTHTKYHVFIKLDRKIQSQFNSTPKCLIQVLDPLLYPLKVTVTEGETSPVKRKFSKGVTRELHIIDENQKENDDNEEIKAIGLKKSISSPIREEEYLKFMKKGIAIQNKNGLPILKPVSEEDENIDMTRLDFEESLRMTIQICVWISEQSNFNELDKAHLLGLSFDLLLEILKLNSMVGIKEVLQNHSDFLKIFLFVLKLDSSPLLNKLSQLLDQLASPKNAPFLDENSLNQLNASEKQRFLLEKTSLDELRVLLVYHLQTVLQWLLDFALNPNISTLYSQMFKDVIQPPTWLNHVSFVLDYLLICSEKVSKSLTYKKRDSSILNKVPKRQQSTVIQDPIESNTIQEKEKEQLPLPPGILKSVSMPMDPDKPSENKPEKKILDFEPKTVEKMSTLSVNTAINLIDLLLPKAERNYNVRDGFNFSGSAKLWSLVFKAILKVKINVLNEAKIYDSLINAFLVASEEIQHTMFPEILHLTQNMINQGSYQKEFCGSVLEILFRFIKQNIDLQSHLSTFNTISFNLLKGWLDILLTRSTPKPEEYYTKPFEKAFCKLNIHGTIELLLNTGNFLINHVNFGGKEGIQLSTESDLMKLNLADDMLKLLITSEYKNNQLAISELCTLSNQYSNEIRIALKLFIQWFLFNQTKENLNSPATELIFSLSNSVSKLFNIIRDHEDVTKIAIKELICLCKQLDDSILRRARSSQLSLYMSLSLNEQNCRILEELLELWVTNDSIAQFLAFEVKGFEFLLDRMGISESEIKPELPDNSKLSLLNETDLLEYLQKEKFDIQLPKDKSKEDKSQSIIKLADLKEEEFANKITIINQTNQHWSGITPDWSLNKKGVRARILFFPMNGVNYSEYSLVLELDRPCEIKQIRIGFNTVWTDYSDKVLGIPSSILLEAGLNKTSLTPIGTLEPLNDEGYSNYSVKIFKKNFLSLKNNFNYNNEIDSQLKTVENKQIKFLKLTFRRPVVTFMENLSLLCNKTYKNICVGISFLSISGYDPKKINANIQASLVEGQKNSALQVLGKLCNSQYIETLNTLARRADVIAKIKSSFDFLANLLILHENWLSPIFLAISHNTDTGDFIIDKFLSPDKTAPSHAKMILEVILTNPTSAYSRIIRLYNYIMNELRTQLMFKSSEKLVNLTGLTYFLETLNSALKLSVPELLPMKQSFILPCELKDIEIIIQGYENSINSPMVSKGLIRLLISLIYCWPPFELKENKMLIKVLEKLWAFMKEIKKICFYEIFGIIIAGSSAASVWLLEEGRIEYLINLLYSSLEESDKNIESQKLSKAIIQIFNSGVAFDDSLKQYFLNQNSYLEIYNKLKGGEGKSILRLSDGESLNLVVEFIKNVVLGYGKQEKLLAETLKEDLTLLETRRDMLYVTKLLLPLLNAELTIPICLHAYDSHAKKWIIEGRKLTKIVSKASHPAIDSFNPKAFSPVYKEAFENTLKELATPIGLFDKMNKKMGWELALSVDTDSTATLGDTVFQKVLKNAPFAILLEGVNSGKNCVCGIFSSQPIGDSPIEDYEYEKMYNVGWASDSFLFYYDEDCCLHFNIPSYPSQNFAGHYHIFEDGGSGISFHYNGQERMFISFQTGTTTYVDFNLYDMKPIETGKTTVPADIPADFQFKRCEFWTTKSFSNVLNTKNAIDLNSSSFPNIIYPPWFIENNPLNMYRSSAVYNVPASINVETMIESFFPGKKLGIVAHFTKERLQTETSLHDLWEFVSTDNRSHKILDLDFDVYEALEGKKEGKSTANYIPNMSIFEYFEQSGGVNKIIEVILKSLNLWKNKEKARLWGAWVQELNSFSNLPHFFSLVIKNKECIELLFQLLKGTPDEAEPSIDPKAPAKAPSLDQKKWDEENQKAVRFSYKILSDVFKIDNNAKIRDFALEKQLLDRFLDRISLISKENGRKLVIEIEEEKEVTINKEKKEEDDGKKKVVKKKGVGYASDNTGQNQKWNISEYHESKKSQSEQLQSLLNIMETFLDFSDWKPPKRFFELLATSALLPLIESAFRSGSLLDMSKDSELFICYLRITKLISKHKSLLPLLLDLDPHYVPKQTESIYTLLSNLKELATIFKSCMNAEISETPETATTSKLANEILNTYELVSQAISDYEMDDTTEDETQMHDILALPLPEAYRLLLKDLRFDYTTMKDTSGAYKHHYASSIGKGAYSPPQTKMVRLAQELADLSTALPIEYTNSIFVRCDQNRVDVMKALIMGASDTPYSHGAYEYDIFFDDNYPNGPPKVNLETTGAGRVRFNPNLYSCGKVCLSLLGTWRGNATENWDPKLSTLLQVLVSLQAIIMGEDVYFNEPGYEGEAGTDEGERKNEAYSNIVRYCNIKFAMTDQLKNPSKGFETVIRRHFYLKKNEILAECNKWVKFAQVREASYVGLVNDHNSTWCNLFKKAKDSFYVSLKEAVKELETELNKIPAPSLKDIQNRKIKKVKVKKEKIKSQALTEGAANLEDVDVSYENQALQQKVLDITDEKVKDRWSRYIGAMGLDAVAKQANAEVLLSGLGPLGVEIAKNIVLSGVKRFSIHDYKKTSWIDLSGQFFLNEEDIGKDRSKVALDKIQQLNYYVKVDLFNDGNPLPLDEETLDKIGMKSYKVIILTESDYKTQIIINNYCSKRGIKFISADTNGPFGRVFLDLGKKFEVLDKNGEELQTIMIKGISNEVEGKIITLDGMKHNLEDGDLILISGVDGMTLKTGLKHPEPNQTIIKQELITDSINGTVHKVKIVDKASFTIGDTTNYEVYIRNGLIKPLKTPIFMDFETFEENLKLEKPIFDQNMAYHDFLKLDSQIILHIAYETLDLFLNKFKRAPSPWSYEDYISWKELLLGPLNRYFKEKTEENEKMIEKNDSLFAKFCFTCSGQFGPLSAFLGGFVAQEIIKAITQKYKPTQQLFYVDCCEITPELPEKKEEWDSYISTSGLNKLSNIRTEGIKICVGQTLLNTIQESKVFMVGAGAIGCELLKNYAMLNIGTSGNGKIIVTDPDVIETSNLNRQFLFREKHLRKPKSSTAAASAIQMNPNLKGHIVARLDKVHEGTAHIFTDEFFENLNIVTNALDNIQARRYIDLRCVNSRIPLIESGTLGPKGHVQVVIPGKTESYSSQEDPQEDNEIPHCTLKMFPEETLHCVEWARDKFGKLFTQKPRNLKKLLDDPGFIPTSSQEIKNLREAVDFLRKKPVNFDDCIAYARKKFQKYFVNDIRQLMYTYPLDHKTKQGSPFWSLPKRPPTELIFDQNDVLFNDFIAAFACLRATIFSIPIPKDSRTDKVKKEIGLKATKIDVIDYKPSDAKSKAISAQVDKPANLEENKNAEENEPTNLDDCEKYKEDLIKMGADFKKDGLKTEEFEKDNDANYHIDFIYSLANCRSRNYKLDPMDWVTVKIKAGRIIPALATTTAAIAGLQTIELVKMIKNCKVDERKNAFLNLAVPILQLSEPGEAPIIKITKDIKVNLWDRWELKVTKNDSLRSVMEQLKNKYNLWVKDVMCGSNAVYFSAIFNIIGKEKDKEEVLAKKISELLGIEDEKYVNLMVTFSKEENGDIIKGTPSVRLYFE